MGVVFAVFDCTADCAGGSLPSGVHGRTGSIRRDRIATDEGRVRRPTKLQRQSTMVRTEVESLPSFWPVFICLLSFTQVKTT